MRLTCIAAPPFTKLVKLVCVRPTTSWVSLAIQKKKIIKYCEISSDTFKIDKQNFYAIVSLKALF